MRWIFLFTLLPAACAIDNGLGLTPPLGWRSYNAFGGRPTQAIMAAMMDAMVDKTRTVDGNPTSLLDLGYNRIGLDGGWNDCFAENHTFHWASDGRPVWNDAFPDPQGMVDKAHTLGLKPGWYLNNW
jgi:alpha-galactosidase